MFLRSQFYGRGRALSVLWIRILPNIPAAHGPVCIPILSCNGVSGRCLIWKLEADFSRSMDILAISIQCRLPFRTGNPLTTM